MITILHGENTDALNNRLKQLLDSARGNSKTIRYLTQADQKELINLGSDLFDRNILYIVLNIDLLNKNLIGKINAGKEDFIIIKEGKLSSKFTGLWNKNARIECFEYPKILFKFLDSIFPGNLKIILNLYYQTRKTVSDYLIIDLLAKRIKELYLYLKLTTISAEKSRLVIQKTNFGDKISESVDFDRSLNYQVLANLPSWRLSEIKKQSNRFSLNRLIGLINRLASVDIESKTTENNQAFLLDRLFLLKLK